MSIIKKIRIKNFKSLEDVEIEMNQLTFLFGPNSSGKSSFIKAMMFLAKNIFPLNTGQTLYKVNDNVDLGTYKDIVTNNDVNNNIVFEFDLEGKFEFPFIDVIIDSDQDFIDMGYDFNFNLLKKNNFFKEFDNLIKHNGSYGDELKGILNKFEFNITFRIVFTNDLKGENLLTLSIGDNILKSRYDYIYRLDKKDVYKDRIEFNPECPYFTFLDKKFVSEIFTHHYIDYFIEFPISLYDNFSSTYNNTVSEYKNLTGKRENIPDTLFFEKWMYLNQTEKKSIYFDVLKFLYLSQRLVPTILKSFFESKHLPTTRQIPKKIYILERNNFNTNEYYGILNNINYETGSINKIFEMIVSKPLNEISFDTIIEIFNEVNSINIATSTKYIINKRIVKSNNIKTAKEIYNEVLKLYFNTNHFKINNQLFKFGFNHFYIIDIQNDVSRIYLLGKNNTKTYMADTSSGFIQVFPIIVCCYLFQKNYFLKINRLKELKDEGNNERDFEENNNLIEYLANESIKIQYSKNQTTQYSTLMIEQPELHLHPKLQSKLAELFNETLSNMDELNSLIVETHSEHLIRKIQVLIARGELDISKLSVQYFNNENGITKVETMEIDEHGLFVKDWPNGFFDDSVNLTMELYEAIREIKKRKN